jgi:hypothetical protein
LERHTSDLGYAYTLRAEAEAIRRGELATISHAEVKAEFGLV